MKACCHRPRRNQRRRFAACRSILSAYRHRPMKSKHSWRTRGPTPMSGWSIGCSRRPITASAGAGTGSTWPATPTRNGYTRDFGRQIWKYRDWVIDAHQPRHAVRSVHDRADRRRHAARRHREQQIATGFHRNTLINEEGGIDAEQFRVEAVVDRVEHDRRGLARADGRLRPVPRRTSTIRSAGRVLPALCSAQ